MVYGGSLSASQQTQIVDANGNIITNFSGGGATSAGDSLDAGQARIQKSHSRDDLTTVETLYTVTADKTLYITSITFSHSNSAKIAIGDNISGVPAHNTETDDVILTKVSTDSPVTITYAVPLKIDTALKAAASATGNFYCHWVGYEE